jgi:hypothetical protein
MIGTKDLHWLAGYLEGEAAFIFTKAKPKQPSWPRITVASIDRDIIDRAASLMKPKKVRPRFKTGLGRKEQFEFVVNSSRAVGWMMTLYPFMGERRKAQIRRALDMWREGPPLNPRSLARVRNGCCR